MLLSLGCCLCPTRDPLLSHDPFTLATLPQCILPGEVSTESWHRQTCLTCEVLRNSWAFCRQGQNSGLSSALAWNRVEQS